MALSLTCNLQNLLGTLVHIVNTVTLFCSADKQGILLEGQDLKSTCKFDFLTLVAELVTTL